MPFDSTPRSLRGARFVTTTTLRPTRSSGLYASASPRNNLPDFIADIDLQLQQPVGARHAFGGFHLADAHFDLRKILDSNFCRSPLPLAGRWRASCVAGADAVPGRWLFPRAACSVPAPWLQSFRSLQIFRRAGKIPSGLPIFVPGLSCPQAQEVHLNRAKGVGLPQLPPDLLRRLRKHGMRQRRNDPQPLGRGVEHGGQALAVFGLLGQRPGLLHGQVFVYRRHLLPDIFERQRKS